MLHLDSNPCSRSAPLFGGAEVSFWTLTGDRQAAKLRAKYLKALLRQDVAYFDTDTNTGQVVSSIASDPLVVQDAISEKVEPASDELLLQANHFRSRLLPCCTVRLGVLICSRFGAVWLNECCLIVLVCAQMGNFIHFIGYFVSGFAVGFSREWRIALVTLAVVPVIALAGGGYAYTLAITTAQASSAYAEAGVIAEQVGFL